MNESIRTFWRLGYFRLFDEAGKPENKLFVSTNDGEWRRLFWRFYWRTDEAID